MSRREWRNYELGITNYELLIGDCHGGVAAAVNACLVRFFRYCPVE